MASKSEQGVIPFKFDFSPKDLKTVKYFSKLPENVPTTLFPIVTLCTSSTRILRSFRVKKIFGDHGAGYCS